MNPRESICLKTFVFLAFVCLFGSTSFADNKAKTQNALKDGLKYSYNSQFDLAEQALDECIKSDPEEPICYWRKLVNEFARLRFNQAAKAEPTLKGKEYDDEFKKLMAWADKGIEKSELKITRNEEVDLYRYVEAAIYGLKGVFQESHGDFVAFFGTEKKMKKLAEQSAYQDAKYLLGFMYLKISERSGVEQWLLRRAKVKTPSRNEAIVMIYDSANKNSGPFVDDIWFLIFSQVKSDKKQADPIYQYLKRKYPLNESLLKYERDGR